MLTEMKFKFSCELHDVVKKTSKFTLQKYVWDQVKAHDYFVMYSSGVSAPFEHAIDLINADVETALQKFHEGMRGAGHCT